MTGPRVRIVHPGGPSCMAQVWIDDQQLMCVTRVEISPIDANDRGPVTAMLTVIDPEIALEAELAELVVREVPPPSIEAADAGLAVIATAAQDVAVSDVNAPLYWITS